MAAFAFEARSVDRYTPATMSRSPGLVLILLCGMLVVSGGCKRAASIAHSGRHMVTPTPVPQELLTELRASGWDERVKSGMGIWVSVHRQQLVVIDRGQIVALYPCSTAARGVGNREGSYQTPLGWHMIDERFGDGQPWGAVFKERKFTGRVWQPDQPTGDDMVLTRIMWLRGLEPGMNQGPGIDSHDRYIYIHGTPEEGKIGRPASHGCVRLTNSDVLDLFERAATGTPVLITDW